MSDFIRLHRLYRDQANIFVGLTHTTLDAERRVIEQFARNTEVKFVAEFSKPIVHKYITGKKIHNNWSAKTVSNNLQAFINFEKYLVEEGYLNEKNISDIPKPKLPKKLPIHRTPEECKFILEWLKLQDYASEFLKARAICIFIVFVYSGIRNRECLTLKLSDISLQQRTLFVQCGKGQKDRIIPLHPTAIKALITYLEQRKKLNTESIYLFPAMRGKGHLSQKTLQRYFQAITKGTNIHVHPHLLRHSFATHMLQGGCDLMTISEMMGHTDIKTTAIYLSLTMKHKKAEICKHALG